MSQFNQPNRYNQPKQQEIDLTKTTPIKCEKCDHDTFQPGLLLRKVSKFLSGDTKDGVAPLQVFYCVKCGNVNKDFYPPELLITEPHEKDEE